MNINSLPLEILGEIFNYLPYESIISVGQVCKVWKDVSTSRRIWDRFPITYNSIDDDTAYFVDNFGNQFDHLTFIEFIHIDDDDDDDEWNMKEILKRCPKINKLYFIKCCIDFQVIKNIRCLAALETLIMRKSYVNKRKNIMCNINFRCHPLLTTLVLTDFGLRDRNFKGLLTCQNLEHVNITNIKAVSQENIVKLLIQQKNKLKTMCLFGGEEYDDTVLKYISECPNMCQVSITKCCKITYSGLKYLNKLCNLKVLGLGYSNVFSAKDLMDFFSNENSKKLVAIEFEKIVNVNMELLNLIAKMCPDIKDLRIVLCPLVCQWDIIKNQIEIKFPNTMVDFGDYDNLSDCFDDDNYDEFDGYSYHGSLSDDSRSDVSLSDDSF